MTSPVKSEPTLQERLRSIASYLRNFAVEAPVLREGANRIDQLERSRDESNRVLAAWIARAESAESALAAERERCATVCAEQMYLGLPPPDYRKGWHAATRRCEAAIRALPAPATKNETQQTDEGGSDVRS